MENLIKYLGNKRSLPTTSKLKNLGTKRLLSFYKAERSRFYGFISSITCECCGEREYNLDSKRKDLKIIEDEWSQYLNKVKNILNTRENIS